MGIYHAYRSENSVSRPWSDARIRTLVVLGNRTSQGDIFEMNDHYLFKLLILAGTAYLIVNHGWSMWWMLVAIVLI